MMRSSFYKLNYSSKKLDRTHKHHHQHQLLSLNFLSHQRSSALLKATQPIVILSIAIQVFLFYYQDQQQQHHHHHHHHQQQHQQQEQEQQQQTCRHSRQPTLTLTLTHQQQQNALNRSSCTEDDAEVILSPPSSSSSSRSSSSLQSTGPLETMMHFNGRFRSSSREKGALEKFDDCNAADNIRTRSLFLEKKTILCYTTTSLCPQFTPSTHATQSSHVTDVKFKSSLPSKQTTTGVGAERRIGHSFWSLGVLFVDAQTTQARQHPAADERWRRKLAIYTATVVGQQQDDHGAQEEEEASRVSAAATRATATVAGSRRGRRHRRRIARPGEQQPPLARRTSKAKRNLWMLLIGAAESSSSSSLEATDHGQGEQLVSRRLRRLSPLVVDNTNVVVVEPSSSSSSSAEQLLLVARQEATNSTTTTTTTTSTSPDNGDQIQDLLHLPQPQPPPHYSSDSNGGGNNNNGQQQNSSSANNNNNNGLVVEDSTAAGGFSLSADFGFVADNTAAAVSAGNVAGISTSNNNNNNNNNSNNNENIYEDVGTLLSGAGGNIGDLTEVSGAGDLLFNESSSQFGDLNLNGGSGGGNSSFCNEYVNIKNSVPSYTICLVFFSLYGFIFAIGLIGNTLTLYAMRRKREKSSILDIFIANLALSDIMLCIFAVPITPIYMLHYGHWVFGPGLCKAFTFAQGSSVYISTFTMISIAYVRYHLIVHPLNESMSKLAAFILNLCTWILGFLVTLPYLMHVGLMPENCTIKFCDEYWEHEIDRFWFSVITLILQFFLPFIGVSFFYGSIFWKLRKQKRRRQLEQQQQQHQHQHHHQHHHHHHYKSNTNNSSLMLPTRRLLLPTGGGVAVSTTTNTTPALRELHSAVELATPATPTSIGPQANNNQVFLMRMRCGSQDVHLVGTGSGGRQQQVVAGNTEHSADYDQDEEMDELDWMMIETEQQAQDNNNNSIEAAAITKLATTDRANQSQLEASQLISSNNNRLPTPSLSVKSASQVPVTHSIAVSSTGIIASITMPQISDQIMGGRTMANVVTSPCSVSAHTLALTASRGGSSRPQSGVAQCESEQSALCCLVTANSPDKTKRGSSGGSGSSVCKIDKEEEEEQQQQQGNHQEDYCLTGTPNAQTFRHRTTTSFGEEELQQQQQETEFERNSVIMGQVSGLCLPETAVTPSDTTVHHSPHQNTQIATACLNNNNNHLLSYHQLHLTRTIKSGQQQQTTTTTAVTRQHSNNGSSNKGAHSGDILALKEQRRRERDKRLRQTNRKLLFMVVLFVFSWLPLNMFNLVQDYFETFSESPYIKHVFVIVHLIACSSVCYNPILYAWMSDNYRQELRDILPKNVVKICCCLIGKA